MSELYKRYRPKTLKGVVGQDGAINSLSRMVDQNKVPHTILLTGPSGTGKTTIARILKEHLQCSDNDFFEVNCADFKGIDFVRDIRRTAGLQPLGGESRVWLIDECHQLTKDAQNAFLKLLEDTPKHVYFMLATTDPQKLLKTIHTRSTEIKLSLLDSASLDRVVRRVLDKEKIDLTDKVVDEIVEAADGSARKALVILEQVMGLENEEDQLAGVQASALNKEEAFKLAQELMFPRGGWVEVARILRGLKDEDPEGIRYLILSYARSCMIGKEDKAPNEKFGGRAFKIIEIFGHNFYDSKQAGLAAACWEVVKC